MFQPQQDESLLMDLLVDAMADSTTDDTDSLFDESGLEDSVFTESDPDTEDDASLSADDDVLPPPEHYLEIGENLDVGRLRQERYSPKTQKQLDRVKEHCIQYENMQAPSKDYLLTLLFFHRYCNYVHKDISSCFQNVDAPFLKGFLCWVCDQRRGINGRRRPGVQYASSLETFWKQYLQVYASEVGKKIHPMIQRQGQDVCFHYRPRA
jgi:hypothetical protein